MINYKVDYKKRFFRLIIKKLSTEEARDIISICINQEKYMRQESLDENYKALYLLFQNSSHSYLEFKFNLGNDLLLLQYKDAILKREKEQEFIKGKNFQESLNIVQVQIQNEFQDLTKEQQDNLAFDIVERIYTLRTYKAFIDEKIAIIDDKITIFSSNTLITQIDLVDNRGKKQIKSKSMIDLLQNRFFEYVRCGYIQYKNVETLNQDLKNLKIKRKHLVSFAIRKIAQSLVSNKILTNVSPKGNSYNLKNEKNEFISLNNKIAVSIFNIVSGLGFDTSFKGRKEGNKQSGSDYISPISEEGKKDFVKDRLKQVSDKVIELNDDLNLYEEYIF